MKNRIEELYYNTKHGFTNLVLFFKLVWNHRGWDYIFVLIFLKHNIEMLKKSLLKSHENFDDLNNKLKDVDRCLEILDNIINDKYSGMVDYIDFDIEFVKKENDLFELKDNLTEEQRKHNNEQTLKLIEIEQNEWNELFDILKNGKYFIHGLNSWWK